MSVRTTKALKASAVASLAGVAFLFAKGETLLADTIRTAGATDAARDQFIVGYLAARLNPEASQLTDDIRRATETIIKAPNTKTTKANRRTEAQERAYANARMAWSRFLKQHEVKTQDKRGGAANGKKGAEAKKMRAPQMAGSSTVAKIDTANPATAPAVPHFQNDAAARDWLARAGVQMRAAHDKNAKRLSIETRNTLMALASLITDALKPSAN